MEASSSGSQKCDVFPSFRGEDVRTGFLSHLRMEPDRGGLINTFNDNGIERSCEIGPELLCAIREARISIVIFSENYASSNWCLDELAEIHNCFKELKQKVIPVFYKVDPSEVRKQNGDFGKVFMKTCEGKSDGEKQRWKQALTDVANLAGEHLQNWSDEASMVKKIANDVFDKLLPPFNGFGDFVGMEDHIKAMESILCLESEEPRMIGIWGQSGIGKSTLGRSLFCHLSPKFPLHVFVTYKSTDEDVFGMKLRWEKQLLVEIFKKNIEVDRLGMVERMLKDKKVLIVLDDVFKPSFLETLVGKTEWFGPGSRIIVITQDRHLLKAHKIDHLYEVNIPDEDIAVKILCRSAFGEDFPPDDFKKLAVEVAKVAGDLPLGLNVLGSSLKGRTKEEWMEVLPELQNGLKGDIMKTLKVSYDRLDGEEQEIFLYIACLFNGKSVKFINDFFGDLKVGVKRLAEKSLICITSKEKRDSILDITVNEENVEMHNLLEKLGREIDRAESKNNPGKRRFLTDAMEIQDVLTDQTGTETVLGIVFKAVALEPDISIDEKSFKAMFNLQYLKIDDFLKDPILRLPNGLAYLSRKLKWLEWDNCPLKCLPSNFKAEFLVELRMEHSMIEKLWKGTQQLRSLKTIRMKGSFKLKEIPDLSKAINLEIVDFCGCKNLESIPSPLNSESLDYLNLTGCSLLRNFPQIKMGSSRYEIEINVEDCLWNKNLPGHDYLNCLRRCYPLKFLPEHLVRLEVKGTNLEKLWEGVQSLGCLKYMNLSESENLKEIPDLSIADNLTFLNLSHCISLETLPSTIRNLQKLVRLEMEECTRLKVLPLNVNLLSLVILNLNGCSSLKSFPRISRSIGELHLDHTAIEEVPCLIEMLPRLVELSMRGCSKLKNISASIFRLPYLKQVDFTDCGGVITVLSDYITVDNVKKRCDEDEDKNNHWYFNFQNCLKLDRHVRELIIQSSFKSTVVLPGGEMPAYFRHRAFGDSLTVILPQSSLSDNFLRFNVCVVVEPLPTSCSSLYLYFRYDCVFYKHAIYVDMPKSWKTDHLVLCSFKFQPTSPASKLEFIFEDLGNWIKEVGIRLLNVFPSQDDRNRKSSETEYIQQPAEKCLKGEALCVYSMITEQQDAQLPIARLDLEPDVTSPSSG